MKYSAGTLEKMGFKVAMYSTAAVLAAHFALREVYTTILQTGHTQSMRSRMTTFPEYRELVDESSWTSIDEKWVKPQLSPAGNDDVVELSGVNLGTLDFASFDTQIVESRKRGSSNASHLSSVSRVFDTHYMLSADVEIIKQ